MQSYGEIYALYAPPQLLPFQIVVGYFPNPQIQVHVVYIDSNLPEQDISRQMTFDNIREGNRMRLIYKAEVGFFNAQGKFYLRIETGFDVLYSEVMTPISSEAHPLRIEWRDFANLVVGEQKIDYESNDFKNILYLCTDIGYPDYEYTEEGETRDGVFFPLKQISEKVYRFTFVAPEFLCDAIRLIPLADEVKVIDPLNKEYTCDNILITPKWIEGGNLARVDVEFHTDTIAKAIGKGYGSR